MYLHVYVFTREYDENKNWFLKVVFKMVEVKPSVCNLHFYLMFKKYSLMKMRVGVKSLRNLIISIS